MTTPDLLFRCCSDSSAGRLNSGKKNHSASETVFQQQGLLKEFESHSHFWDQTTPTALVSTTTRLLRAIHTAFDKLHSGEPAERIEILFIKPPAASSALHSADDLARKLHWLAEKRKNYKDEYLFEWAIPECSVIHRVTMATLLRRGLSIQLLCGSQTHFADFPRMREFRMVFRQYWGSLRVYERGFRAGRVACLFGRRELSRRLADEVLMFAFAVLPYGRVGDGIKEALEDCEDDESGDSDGNSTFLESSRGQMGSEVIVW